MSRTAMNFTSNNGREIAQRARADAAAAEALAVRASVDRLLIELRAARAEARASRLRLELIRRRAVAALPQVRDERAALALGDIAARAEWPTPAASLHAIHSDH
jgi:hypothetical protein